VFLAEMATAAPEGTVTRGRDRAALQGRLIIVSGSARGTALRNVEFRYRSP
jgi:hypothetical protein